MVITIVADKQCQCFTGTERSGCAKHSWHGAAEVGRPGSKIERGSPPAKNKARFDRIDALVDLHCADRDRIASGDRRDKADRRVRSLDASVWAGMKD